MLKRLWAKWFPPVVKEPPIKVEYDRHNDTNLSFDERFLDENGNATTWLDMVAYDMRNYSFNPVALHRWRVKPGDNLKAMLELYEEEVKRACLLMGHYITVMVEPVEYIGSQVYFTATPDCRRKNPFKLRMIRTYTGRKAKCRVVEIYDLNDIVRLRRECNRLRYVEHDCTMIEIQSVESRERYTPESLGGDDLIRGITNDVS